MLKKLLLSGLIITSLQVSFAQEIIHFKEKIQEVKVDPFTGILL